MTAEYRRAVLDNAKRLLEDARVLHTGKRYPTACAMAIYALEECGKYLLDRWQEEGFKVKLPGKSSFHKQKQFATAAVVSSLAINQLIEKHHNGKKILAETLAKESEASSNATSSGVEVAPSAPGA